MKGYPSSGEGGERRLRTPPSKSPASNNASTASPKVVKASNKTASKASRSTSAIAEDKGKKYIVIITNVENDFGALHNAGLPYHCGLREEFEEKLDVEQQLRGGGQMMHRLKSTRLGCSYTVRSRTETRSAEVSFYGPADADFSPMLFAKPQRRLVTSGPNGKAAPKSRTAEETTSAEGNQEASAKEIVESVEGTHGITLEQLAWRLRHQRYYQEDLHVQVHRPGRAAGDVLARLDSRTGAVLLEKDDASASATKSEGEAEEASDGDDSVDVKGTAPGSKRQREEDDGEGGTDEMSTPEKRGRTESHTTVEATKSKVIREVAGTKKNTAQAILRQFPNRQKDFVSAEASLSKGVPEQLVHRRLRHVPGYMSCWTLFKKHVRVVFRDAESLCKAKQLLDQFELDSGLRMSFILSERLARVNRKLVETEEGEGEDV